MKSNSDCTTLQSDRDGLAEVITHIQHTYLATWGQVDKAKYLRVTMQSNLKRENLINLNCNTGNITDSFFL